MTVKERMDTARQRGDWIARMHASGMTQKDIGEAIGICNQRVSQLLRNHRERLARSRVAKVTEDGKHLIRVWRIA